MRDEFFLECKNLNKNFYVNKKIIKAVDGVSFKVKKGKTLGLVGESGCGKSTLARILINLLKFDSGDILFENKSIFLKNKTNFFKNMQLIFQDPYLSLNPTMTIEEIIAEPLKIQKRLKKQDIKLEVEKLLYQVNLPINCRNRFPHEFSGGQRQRIAIARAISTKPTFIILDEPLASLDVTISAQIINLLKKLQKDFNLTYLFISHNLATVKTMSDDIAVMHMGKFVEYASKDDIFFNPKHPFTKKLIESIPRF
ncbi:MAG: ABC transporter ATP-binding protein [Parachlamydiales bacterium]|nr:ABC transporter ATP-binding protein [Parachlamydiales bacterium]